MHPYSDINVCSGSALAPRSTTQPDIVGAVVERDSNDSSGPQSAREEIAERALRRMTRWLDRFAQS